MRVNNWRMRPFGPLSWTFTEVPRENAIAVGAFVAIRQVGPTRRVGPNRHGGGGDRTSARIAAKTRPHRLISSPLDWVLTIVNFERHSIIPRYRPISHRRNFASG